MNQAAVTIQCWYRHHFRRKHTNQAALKHFLANKRKVFICPLHLLRVLLTWFVLMLNRCSLYIPFCRSGRRGNGTTVTWSNSNRGRLKTERGSVRRKLDSPASLPSRCSLLISLTCFQQLSFMYGNWMLCMGGREGDVVWLLGSGH